MTDRAPAGPLVGAGLKLVCARVSGFHRFGGGATVGIGCWCPQVRGPEPVTHTQMKPAKTPKFSQFGGFRQNEASRPLLIP